MGAMIGAGPEGRKPTGAGGTGGARRADAAILAGILAAGLAACAAAAERRHAALAAGGPDPDPSDAIHLVDLGTAGTVELRLLPGVGPRLAERIAEERRANGPFEGLEDLDRRVPGVGPARTRWWRGRVAGEGRPAPAGEGRR
jgi:competence protein ComEA